MLKKKINRILFASLVLTLNIPTAAGATGFFRRLFTRNTTGTTNVTHQSIGDLGLNSKPKSTSLKMDSFKLSTKDELENRNILIGNIKDDLHRNLDINQIFFTKLITYEPDSSQRVGSGRVHKYEDGDVKIIVNTDENGIVTGINVRTSILLYDKDFITNTGKIKENNLDSQQASGSSQSIYENRYVTEVKFYKLGYFKNNSSDAYLEREVFKGKDKNGREQYFIKNSDGSNLKVVETNSNFFSPVMGQGDSDLYDSISHRSILMARNKWGEEKRVILETITVNGEEKTVAYQMDDGIWRDIVKSGNGNLWLGDVLMYENLTSEVISKLRGIAKLYNRVGSPFLTATVTASRAVSGFIK